MSDTIVIGLITVFVMIVLPLFGGLIQLGRVLEQITGINRFVREDFVQVQIKVANNSDDINDIKTDIAVLRTRLDMAGIAGVHEKVHDNAPVHPHPV